MVEQEVVIVNEMDLGRKVREMGRDGPNDFHVLSDFDRTITYALSNGGKTPSVISQLRSDPKYLGQAYFDEAHKLHAHYYPIEVGNLPMSEKMKEMHDWWRKHFELLIRSGLSRQLISQVTKEKPLHFRNGSLEFIKLLNQRNIPLVIMSAAPGDILIEYLKQNDLLFPNIEIVSNMYEFDEEGRAIRIKEPIIHTFNKTEVTLDSHPIYKLIEKRRNVLLMGDSLGDVGMVEGFPYKNLIKIGFFNDPDEGSLDQFKKDYDVVLTGDQDFSYVNKLMREMFGK